MGTMRRWSDDGKALQNEIYTAKDGWIQAHSELRAYFADHNMASEELMRRCEAARERHILAVLNHAAFVQEWRAVNCPGV
jgi:hypothetical protein